MSFYTSNDEFDLVKRVHTTNETPLYSLYDGVHSALKNDLWKWFLGTQDVDWDLSYGPYDQDGEQTYFKSVNGSFSPDFGPSPTSEDPSPTYHKMKLSGTLMPEFDLYLHEIYRYLDVLYPDHQDYVDILTNNEINSMINSAAAMVDYSPNLKFFELLCDSFGLGKESDTDKEALKLKIRDLKANAYRRKFYGSSLGYKMFGASIFSNLSMFPLGTYLPIKPEGLVDGAKSQTPIGERTINVRSGLYRNKFKLIDWSGSCGNVATDADNNVYCKLYGAPGFDYQMFLSAESSDDVEEFNNIEANNYLASDCFEETDTVYVRGTASELLNVSPQVIATKVAPYAPSSVTTHFVKTSKRVPVKYVDTYRLGTWEEFFSTLTAEEIAKVRSTIGDGFDTFVANTNTRTLSISSASAIEFLFRIFNRINDDKYSASKAKFSTLKLVASPHFSGLALIEPERAVTIYEQVYSATASISKSGVLEGYYTPQATVAPGVDLAIGEVICSQDFSTGLAESISLVKVGAVNFGQVKFTSNQVSAYKMDSLLGYSCPEPTTTSLYGLVLLSQDGETRIFVQGELTLKTKTQTLYTVPDGGSFVITAIPDALSDELLAIVYPVEYASLTSRRADLVELLAIDSRRDAAQQAIDEIDAEVAYLKINKAKIVERRAYPGKAGASSEYSTYSIFSGCYVEKFLKIVGDFTQMVNNDGRYFWHEMVTYYGALIDYVDFGTVSLLPIVSTGSVSTDSLNGFFAEVKTEQVTGQGFQYLDLVSGYVDKLAEFTPSVKAPGYFTAAMRKQFSYPQSGDNSTVSDVATYDIQIEGTVVNTDDDRHTIKFVSEQSLRDIQCVTVGDPLYGPGVQSGTYVTDVADDTVTVSDKLLKDGDVLFTFTTKFNCAGKDIESEFSLYRSQLKADGLLKLANPFENGIWPSRPWPNASASYVDGLIDVSLFSVYRPTFYKVMKGTHSAELKYSGNTPTNYVVPSTVKFQNDLFVEMNLTRVIPLANRAGVKNTLCNVEFLNYLSGAMGEIARGTDVVNCGTQLSMQADLSGYYTQVTGQQYTDPAVKLLFQTFKCQNGMPVPCYAQVGTKGEGRFNWFKSADDNVSPMVYGGSFWDGQTDGLADAYTNLVANRGTYSKRSVWASESYTEEKADDNSLDEMRYVEKPLFEIALGEYDVQYDYADASDASNKVHTIQCNFYRQKFDRIKFVIESSSDEAIKLISNKFENLNVVTEINKRSVVVDGPSTVGYRLGVSQDTLKYLCDVAYCGSWEPAVANDEIAYPEVNPDYAANIDSTMYYMVVEKGKTLSYNGGRGTIAFQDNSLLVLTKRQNGTAYWRPLTFALGGSNYPTSIQTDTVQEKDSFAVMCKNLAFNYFTDSSATVVIDSVESFRDNFGTRSQDITNTFDSSRCYVYVCLFDGVDANGGTAYDTTASTVFSAGSYVAVVYDDFLRQPKFFKLNINSRFVASLQFDMPKRMSITEFKLLTGATVKYQRTNLRSKVTNSVASIPLPKPFLTNGSVDITVEVDGGFISKGYRATADGKSVDTEKLVYFNISNSAVFYDEQLGYFYVSSYEYKLVDSAYVKVGASIEKFYLYFSDPTYFKNTLRNYGRYTLKKTQTSGSSSVDYSPVVEQIDGFTSFYDRLSNEDELLEVKEVVTRSFYNALYNSVGFDAHTELATDVVAVGGDFLELYALPEDGISSKIALKAKADALWPAKVVDGTRVQVFEKATVDGKEVDKTDMYFGLGKAFKSPRLSDVTGGVSSSSIVESSAGPSDPGKSTAIETKYFKNNLITLASVNPEDPTKAYKYGSESAFARAVSMLQANDSVVSMVALSSDTENSKTVKISLVGAEFAPRGPYTLPTYIAYNGVTFVAVAPDGYVYYKDQIESLLAAGEEIALNVAPVKVGAGSAVSPATYGSANCRVQAVDWDDEDKKWYLSFDLSNGSEEITQIYESETLQFFNSAFAESEVTSLPADFNINDYQTSSVIDASTPLTIPEGVADEDWIAHPINPPDAQDGAVAKRSFYVSNKSTGDKVLIRGKYVFFKTTTEKVDGTLTPTKYWKMAVLPRDCNVTKMWLTQLGDNEARHGNVASGITDMAQIVAEQLADINAANNASAEQKATLQAAASLLASFSLATYADFSARLRAGVSIPGIYKVTVPNATTDPTFSQMAGKTLVGFSSTTASTDPNVKVSTFSYAYADYVPVGSPDGVADTQSAYLDYLADVLTYVVGTPYKQEIVSGYIDKVELTSDSLILKTTFDTVSYFPLAYSHSVAGIQNNENWTTPEFLASAKMLGSTNFSSATVYAVGTQGNLVGLGTKEEEFEKYIFQSLTMATGNGNKVVAGYWRKKSEIVAFEGADDASGSDLDVRKEHIPGYTGSNDFWYPCLMFAKGDNSFETAKVESSTANLGTYSFGVEFANYKVVKVVYEGGEFRAFLADFSGHAHACYLKAPASDPSKWEWVKPATSGYIGQFTSSGAIQFVDVAEAPATVAFNPISVSESGTETLRGNDAFTLSSPNALLGSNVKVRSIDDESITFDQGILTQASGKANVTVLLAIKTRNRISNVGAYLDKTLIGECVNQNGTLLVSAFSEVPSYYEADRAFVYRELLSTKDRTERVLIPTQAADGSIVQVVSVRDYTAQIDDDAYGYGYPATAEDADREFYDYQSYVDADNAVAYSVKPLLNNDGNQVALCNELGEILVDREVHDLNAKCVSAYQEIVNDKDPLTYSVFAGAPKYASLKEAAKYGVSIRNKAFTASIAGKDLSITYMSEDVNRPQVTVKANSSLFDAIANLLYPYDEESVAEYVEDLGIKDVVTYSYDANGNVTTSSTVPASAQYEDRGGYVYDVANKRYNLRQRVAMKAKVTVPYLFYGEDVKVSYNPSLKADSTGTLTLNDTLTGVFMNPLGYGGYSTNPYDTFASLPWSIDPAAFLAEDLYNTLGEPVYLSTKYGEKVYHDDGTLFINPNLDFVTLSEGDMKTAARTITASQEIASARASSTATVYMPEDSAYTLVLTNEIAPANRDKVTGLIVKPETTEGTAILYKGIERVTDGVTFSVDVGENDQLGVQIGADGKYIMSHWNDNQANQSEKATVTVKATIAGKTVATAQVTYIEFTVAGAEDVTDLFPSSTSDEVTAGMLLRGIRYGAMGELVDTVVEIKIPEVNSYSFVNFTQLADPVSSQDGGKSYLTFKLSAPLTYTGKDCVIFLEDGTLSDKITFKQLIDSSYAVYATNDSLDAVDDRVPSVCFRAYKGKDNVTDKSTGVSAVTDTGIPLAVVKYPSGYYKASATASLDSTTKSVRLSVTVDGNQLVKVLPVRFVAAAPEIVFVDDDNVVSKGHDVKFTIRSVGTKEVTIKGTYSPVICKVPKYVNFKSLLQNEGQVIQSMSAIHAPVNSPILLTVATRGFTLSEKIITSNEAFNRSINDGNAHVLEFNWLTRSTISQEPKAMNDKTTFVKLALSQIEKYTPDRVYFPDDGYPQPAVTMNNVIYNAANSYMYEAEYWFNDNQKRIYECDKDGNYVVYGMKDGALAKVPFDYATNFSSTKDQRFNPHKPVYTSCSEWYKSKFYLAGKESNPYWQVIKFADTFNVDVRDFEQLVNIYSYEKGTDEMKLIKVEDGQKFLNIAKAVTAALNNNELAITKSAEYIDHKNGKLQFILQQPDDVYRSSQQFVKFGIWASNPFYGNKIFTDDDAVIKLRSILNMNYIVNSTENVSNPLDKDADIVQVSELGIFDANHSLIAYATFPPIEYHSKSQHASFVCYIKDGTCSSL